LAHEVPLQEDFISQAKSLRTAHFALHWRTDLAKLTTEEVPAMISATMPKARPTGTDSRSTPPPATRRKWSDESLAPAIDERLLQELVQGKLAEPKARALYRLIHSFKSWDEAHTQAMLAEQRRQRAAKR
jgi:hypothetical protein